MQHTIIAVGKMRSGPEKDLYAQYAGRIQPQLLLKEVEEKRALKGAALKSREGELLGAAIPKGARVVALDETGKTLSSRQLAEHLGRWLDDGGREVAWLIGGADGLDGAVRERADLALSLGAVTWPHLLVRALVAEQIYRTQAILSGHPYHRD